MKEIYVGNLAYSTSESDIRNFLADFGSIANVKLITDRDTGQSKGFAFVEFATQAEAEKAAKEANGKTLDGRAIKVNMSKPKERTGGGNGGRSGGGRGGW